MVLLGQKFYFLTEANKKHKFVTQANNTNCFNLKKPLKKQKKQKNNNRKKQQQQQIIRSLFRTQSKIKDRLFCENN